MISLMGFPLDASPVMSPVSCVFSGCTYEGQTFSSGEQFTDPRDDCQHCTCQLGSVLCHQKACPDVTCLHPAVPIGQCCPECKGTGSGQLR